MDIGFKRFGISRWVRIGADPIIYAFLIHNISRICKPGASLIRGGVPGLLLVYRFVMGIRTVCCLRFFCAQLTERSMILKTAYAMMRICEYFFLAQVYYHGVRGGVNLKLTVNRQNVNQGNRGYE
jgi:hypothetical protein